MTHNPGFNRNLYAGKRPNKGITKYGKYKTLSERLVAEVNSLADFKRRVYKKK